MKKFLDFTLTDNTQKKLSQIVLSKNSVSVPISFSHQISSKKWSFWKQKNEIFNKQAISNKKKQYSSGKIESSKKPELIKIQNSLLCTISGGQDSILTFFILLHTKKIKYLKILYCQHLWQIKNFFSARLIFQVTYLVKVPYTLILPHQLVEKENQSREWRRKVFCRFSKLEQVLTILTGHTKTDNLEKNLNNIFRGTSPTGLTSFNFFNSSDKIGLFFSTINFTGYFFNTAQKPTKFYQKFFFQTNLKNKIIDQISPENVVFGKTICPITNVKKTKIENFSFLTTNKLSKKRTLKKSFFLQKYELLFYLVDNFVQGSNFKNYSKTDSVKTKKLITITPVSKQKQQFCSKQRLRFVFLKPLNVFDQLTAKKTKIENFSFLPPIVSLNQVKQQKLLLNNFPLISKDSRNKLAFDECCSKTKTTKKLESIINKLISFSFFDSTKTLPKIKTNKNSKQKKSFSFCFSTQFLNLQVSLIKPLENISRFTISKFLNLYNLPLLIDMTNFSYRFSRNKIRHQFIPFIRSLINLNVDYRVSNFFKMISQEHQDTQTVIQELFFIYKIFTLRFLIKKTKFDSSSNFSNLKTILFFEQPALKFKHLIPRTLKRKKSRGPGPNFDDSLVTMQTRPKLSYWVEKYLIKVLLKKKLELKARTLLQKIFFEYKNVNLSYSQIRKLQDFYNRKNF